MGYQPGKGLGKNLQGISTPVDVHMREGRGAIGTYGPEKATSVPNLVEWKKNNVFKKKMQYYHRSVENDIEKGKKVETTRIWLNSIFGECNF